MWTLLLAYRSDIRRATVRLASKAAFKTRAATLIYQPSLDVLWIVLPQTKGLHDLGPGIKVVSKTDQWRSDIGPGC